MVPTLTGRTMGSACIVPGLCLVCTLSYSHELNGEQQECTSSFEIFPGRDGTKFPNLCILLAFIL